jgi:antitoxin component YwqK of YwqJK toxin-antitoxin module
MRKLVLFLLGLACNLVSLAQVHVSGYTKANGTYVAPYTRSSPDGNPYNNYSYPGNTNPYTGKVATGNPDTYLYNYYNKNGGFTNSTIKYKFKESTSFYTGVYLRVFSKGDKYIVFNIYDNADNYTGYLSLNSDKVLRVFTTDNKLIKTVDNFYTDIIPVSDGVYSASSYSQPASLDYSNSRTVEKRIQYKDGLVTLHVLIENPNIKYDDNLEYTWFNEYSSDVKKTKGGNGGKLLSGSYKVYSLNGDLLVDCNYSNGLLDGSYKSWSEKGELTGTSIYVQGLETYSKYKNKEGDFVEFSDMSKVFKAGGQRRIYDVYGNLLEEDVNIDDSKKDVTTYYANSRKAILSKLTLSVILPGYRYGEYQEFYESGKTKVIGMYHDGTELRDGTWTYYNEDGTVKYEMEYTVSEKKHENGETSEIGNLLHLDDKWVQIGTWTYFNEKGVQIKTVEFDPFKPTTTPPVTTKKKSSVKRKAQ